MSNSVADSAVLGWLVIVAGPLLALIAFFVARARRNSRWGFGAAAIVGLVWFVVTAESQPAGWTAYWNSHSISAGLIASVLAIVAGWFFISEKLANQHLVALMSTWREWVEYQCGFVTAMMEQPASVTDSVIAQRVMVADISSRLMIQQQWIAALFVITALRSDERGPEFITILGKLRDEATFATRKFAQLGVWLDVCETGYLDEESLNAIWGPALGSLASLHSRLIAMRRSLGEAHWKAQTDSGKSPTHPFVADINEMEVKGSRPWHYGSVTDK